MGYNINDARKGIYRIGYFLNQVRSKFMSFFIAKGNLLEQKVDAIVVPSQPSLRLEGSVGGQVKDACSEELLLELKQYKNINISECVIANSYNNTFKKVILVANPKWDKDYSKKEKDIAEYNLQQSYLSCMEKAQDFNLSSIAFPLLSIGAYDFPKRKAIEIAIKTITDFIDDNELDVVLVVYSGTTFKTYKDIFSKYTVIGGPLSKQTEAELQTMRREQETLSWYRKDIETIIGKGTKSKSFAEKIEYYIAAKGLTKLDCYNGVISKNQFNNYLKGNVKPNKYTIVSLGINMQLNMHEINDLLSTFGEMLDERRDVDLIIMNGIFHDKDVEEINNALSTGGFYPVLKTAE